MATKVNTSHFFDHNESANASRRTKRIYNGNLLNTSSIDIFIKYLKQLAKYRY